MGSLLVVGIHPVAGSPAVDILHEGLSFVRGFLRDPQSDVQPALLSYAMQLHSSKQRTYVRCAREAEAIS